MSAFLFALVAQPAMALEREPSAQAEAATEWTAHHGEATVSGTTTETRTAFVGEGRLTNTGSECYSVWFDWMVDFGWSTERVVAQCGPGVKELNHLFPTDIFFSPLASGWVYVCEGTEDEDCGKRVLVA
ncbi:hypothetical protein [Streptomyces macrosporus]|uniref:hypothetical protein n=1 Tax=Streptomyces macrosporus TaxID=44032 RepID=UPI0031DB122C